MLKEQSDELNKVKTQLEHQNKDMEREHVDFDKKLQSVDKETESQPQVVGPPQPVVTIVGEHIILPCHLEPAVDARSMAVEWTRPDLKPRLVLVWRAGQKLNLDDENPSYRGRTSLLTDKLKSGDISLKLSKVRLSDRGKYKCYVPTLNRDSVFELVVGAVLSPVISLVEIDKDSETVVLQCESKGWYPEPELLWLDAEGKILSAGPTETVRGPDDLYTVSSRVTVEKRHSNNITCRVQQRNINQTRETQIKVTGQPQVVGPPQPVVAVVGEHIILPCHLEPAVDARSMAVEWTRPDLKPRLVLVWRAGQKLNLDDENPSYRGRTSLLTDKLKNGDISLKLFKVKLSDGGKYKCYVPTLNRDSVFELVVGAVSSPVISLVEIDKDSETVVLQCESKGWYPEPELLWLDAEGKILSAGPTETVRGPDDLYTVSSRVTVEKRHSNNITCRVQQRNINHIRET
ncbi:butyrophilin-like protein 2, partial [Anabas testudineus]|uniref:butyrophilin-like protein 2 n=1 Tax=Anabas testudineus TaxID=64144 RepID=UPI000E45BBCE